jgi:hypothetical protein
MREPCVGLAKNDLSIGNHTSRRVLDRAADTTAHTGHGRKKTWENDEKENRDSQRQMSLPAWKINLRTHIDSLALPGTRIEGRHAKIAAAILAVETLRAGAL